MGIAFSDVKLNEFLNKARAPYNISALPAHLLEQSLTPASAKLMHKHISSLLAHRKTLAHSIAQLPGVLECLPSDCNFFLARLGTDGKPDSQKAKSVQKRLATDDGIVVRYRGDELMCEGCLRITVGTSDMNEKLVAGLRRVLETAG